MNFGMVLGLAAFLAGLLICIMVFMVLAVFIIVGVIRAIFSNRKEAFSSGHIIEICITTVAGSAIGIAVFIFGVALSMIGLVVLVISSLIFFLPLLV